jgi:hypothetical protein
LNLIVTVKLKRDIFFAHFLLESPETSPDGGQSSCWWATMGCFGSASSKQQADSNSSDDSKSQKRRSDAITKQLQKDKQASAPLNNECNGEM